MKTHTSYKTMSQWLRKAADNGERNNLDYVVYCLSMALDYAPVAYRERIQVLKEFFGKETECQKLEKLTAELGW